MIEVKKTVNDNTFIVFEPNKFTSKSRKVQKVGSWIEHISIQLDIHN